MASHGSSVGAFQFVVLGRERQDMICRFHDSFFAGHLDVSRTVYRIGSIGRGCVKMFIITWHHVLFVWPGSLCAHR